MENNLHIIFFFSEGKTVDLRTRIYDSPYYNAQVRRKEKNEIEIDEC